MARKFLTPVTLPALSQEPSSGIRGTIYFDINTNLIKVYNGAFWESVGGVSAANGILDHTHNYDGTIDLIKYRTLADANKFVADGGSASDSNIIETLDGGDAYDN